MIEHPEGTRTALYRLFNAQDELIYIGITWMTLPERMDGHDGKRWWEEVDHATAVWYETREEADRAETEAIKAERPKYNKAKTGTVIRKPRRRRPPAQPSDQWPLTRVDEGGLWIRVPAEVVGVSFTYPPSRESPGICSGNGGIPVHRIIPVWSASRAS